MKPVFILLLFASQFLKAQTPAQFNYQGVARNNAGIALFNQIISIRFTIHNSTPAGGINYQESRTTTTNANGLFAVVIGSTGATNVTGSIASINWAKYNLSKYLQVEIDPAGGNSFTDLGTTQLVSVPYAEYSRSTSNVDISLFTGTPSLSTPPLISGGQSLPVLYSPLQLTDPNYNNTTGEYTIPSDGNYFISYSATIIVFSNGGTCYGSIKLLRNGNSLFADNRIGKYYNNNAIGEYIPFSNTYIGAFTAGQKLLIQTTNSGNSSDPLSAFRVDGLHLFIYKIGNK